MRLLRSIAPLLSSFFKRRVGGDAADDLVQEVLVAVHCRGSGYDASRPFTPWLFAIARRKLTDHFRYLRRHLTFELREELAGDTSLAGCDARLDVSDLLSTLPAKQAWAIRQMHIIGMTAAEAACRAGIGVSDVKVSVHRGIRALQAHIRTTPN